MQNDDVVHELKRISARLDQLTTVLVGYISKAEKEVPEYLRRLTMYYSDLFHAKYLWEDAGLQNPVELKAEIDRVHHRILECIEEESMQGGTFHEHIQRFRKEGKAFGRRQE
jgi:hypothetical protein